MLCPKCGTENHDNNFKCARCGEFLHAPQTVVTSSETLGGLIPTGNPPALAAYYLGIFSIIPLLGILLGIAAVVLGAKGLRKADEHPEVKGKIHAWVGIVAGGIFAILYLLATGLVLFYSGRS